MITECTQPYKTSACSVSIHPNLIFDLCPINIKPLIILLTRPKAGMPRRTLGSNERDQTKIRFDYLGLSPLSYAVKAPSYCSQILWPALCFYKDLRPHLKR